MNSNDPLASAATSGGNLQPTFDSPEQEQHYRKQRLAASYRLFGKFGFDEGAAGHITVRDPIDPSSFWVNSVGISFKQIKVSSLIRVSAQGEILEGEGYLNKAAFVIHSAIHEARPDVIAAAHSHSIYGKAWSTLNRKLDPLTQDACAFYNDHEVFDRYTGVVLDENEGRAIAETLGNKKACILRNHGLLTAAESVEAAVWWYITMERSCQAQLLAEAAGTPQAISDDDAANTYAVVGNHITGWFSFQPLYHSIIEEQADCLE